jgi:hypothetical protein
VRWRGDLGGHGGGGLDEVLMRDLEILLMALVIIFIVLLLVKGRRPKGHPDDLTERDYDDDGPPHDQDRREHRL